MVWVMPVKKKKNLDREHALLDHGVGDAREDHAQQRRRDPRSDDQRHLGPLHGVVTWYQVQDSQV